MDSDRKILIVDDDPTHLKLYSWIVNRAGYKAITALVGAYGVELPPNRTAIDLVLMDYNFGGTKSAVDIATTINATFSEAPILVLSDQPFMPPDIASRAAGFVRKGDPDLLLQTIHSFLPQ